MLSDASGMKTNTSMAANQAHGAQSRALTIGELQFEKMLRWSDVMRKQLNTEKFLLIVDRGAGFKRLEEALQQPLLRDVVNERILDFAAAQFVLQQAVDHGGLQPLVDGQATLK